MLKLEAQVVYEEWLRDIRQRTEQVMREGLSLGTKGVMTDSEDLGDYIETISTLLSFAPRAGKEAIQLVKGSDGGS